MRIACVRIAIEAVWEGLAEHSWSEAQLRELEGRLMRYDFLRDIERPVHGERAAGILTADLLRRGKYRLSDSADAVAAVFLRGVTVDGV